MPGVTELSAFVVLGLAGSWHCAGMCGPFAASLGWSRSARRAAWLRAASYVIGKAASYAMLATLLALGVTALAGGAVALERTRSLLAWIAGAVMIVAALQALGSPWLRSPRIARIVERPCAALIGASRAEAGALGALVLGLVNGCLPCGLSWSAIALAAAQGGTMLVLGPLVFGLATAPVLVSLALGGASLPAGWRGRAQRVAALLMLVFGVWTAWRGGLPFGGEHGGRSAPPCCESSGAR